MRKPSQEDVYLGKAIQRNDLMMWIMSQDTEELVDGKWKNYGIQQDERNSRG